MSRQPKPSLSPEGDLTFERNAEFKTILLLE